MQLSKGGPRVGSETAGWRNPIPVVLLFLFGALAHFLFFRAYVHHAYLPGGSRDLVNNPLTNGGVAVLGGFFVCWLLKPLIRLFRSGHMPGVLATMGKGSVRAIGATTLALECLYILGSAFSGIRFAVITHGNPLLLSLGFFIETQTYGMEPLMLSLPFAIAYGGAISVFLKILEHRRAVNAPNT